MTGKEWSNAFKKIEGREPSPQEFMEAKKAGFPELVVEKSGSLTAAQWTEAFTQVYNRNPSPQEFMAAKTQGFPAIVGPEVDEEPVLESQASPSEEIAYQPVMPEEAGETASEPEESVTQFAQANAVQEEPIIQASPEIEVTEEVQPTQAVATPEDAQAVMGTSQIGQTAQSATSQPVESVPPATNGVPPVNPVPSTATHVSQSAGNKNLSQVSAGVRILRVLAMIAIFLLTIALAVVLGYFALGPLLEMLG